jgi:hypothetical protein
VYILNLCRSELHILVRSEIHSLAEWLPVLKLVEPRLKPAAVVLGEDASEPEYLDYVRNPANGNVWQLLPIDEGNGNELTVRNF